MWPFCGYNEIQKPRRKNILIDYEKLQGLFGSKSYDHLRNSHKGWVEEYLRKECKSRQDKWTDSIAVGDRHFVEKVKAVLGFRAKGRDVQKRSGGYCLREEATPYNGLFDAKKDDIGFKNTCLWQIKTE
jgi:putative transposase